MHEFLMVLAVAGATTLPAASPSMKTDAPITKQEARYIGELRTSLKTFQADTARFIGMVNGPYTRKSPEELKKMAEAYASLQKGESALQGLFVPPRVKPEHVCLVKGCDLIVSGAGVFYGVYKEGLQPKLAPGPLGQASRLFATGYKELSAANQKLSDWVKKQKK